MRTSGTVWTNAVNHAAEHTLTPYRAVGMGREAEAGRAVGIARGRPLLRFDIVQVVLPFVVMAPVRGQNRQATRGKGAAEPRDRALGSLGVEMSE